MRFFEKCRPEFYFHGGRLVKDGKSGKRFWRLQMVITLKPAEVLCCDEVIQNNYEAIEVRDSRVEEIKIGEVVEDQVIELFLLEGHKAPAIRIGWSDLTELRMTRTEDLTELWVRVEAEFTDKLHAFVGESIFTRLWVEFSPRQKDLLPKVAKAPKANAAPPIAGAWPNRGSQVSRRRESAWEAARR